MVKRLTSRILGKALAPIRGRRDRRHLAALRAAQEAIRYQNQTRPAHEPWKDRQTCLGYLDYQAFRIAFRHYADAQDPRIHFPAVHNALPNRGPLPVERAFGSAREVVTAFADPQFRQQGLAGFEGFAPDDAICDDTTESWERWSYARLGAVIAQYAFGHYRSPTLLELGCGAAHFFFFLRAYGIRNYFGLDGNPYFLQFNEYLRGCESQFRLLDLQDEIRLSQEGTPLQFDMVCTFEVLEHIREDRIGHLLRTIRNHMHARSLAVCTASLQDDLDVHILVRPREWWLAQFAQVGLRPAQDAEELLQDLGANHPFNWDLDEHPTNLFALRVRE